MLHFSWNKKQPKHNLRKQRQIDLGGRGVPNLLLYLWQFSLTQKAHWLSSPKRTTKMMMTKFCFGKMNLQLIKVKKIAIYDIAKLNILQYCVILAL